MNARTQVALQQKIEEAIDKAVKAVIAAENEINLYDYYNDIANENQHLLKEENHKFFTITLRDKLLALHQEKKHVPFLTKYLEQLRFRYYSKNEICPRSGRMICPISKTLLEDNPIYSNGVHLLNGYTVNMFYLDAWLKEKVDTSVFFPNNPLFPEDIKSLATELKWSKIMTRIAAAHTCLIFLGLCIAVGLGLGGPVGAIVGGVIGLITIGIGLHIDKKFTNKENKKIQKYISDTKSQYAKAQNQQKNTMQPQPSAQQKPGATLALLQSLNQQDQVKAEESAQTQRTPATITTSSAFSTLPATASAMTLIQPNKAAQLSLLPLSDVPLENADSKDNKSLSQSR